MSNPVTRKMAALLDLAEGCGKHPSYRARKAPTSGCVECAYMWKSRQELAALAAERGIVIGYTAEQVEDAVVKVRAAIDTKDNGWGKVGGEAGHQALNMLLRQLYGGDAHA